MNDSPLVAWDAVDPAAARALELAHHSLTTNGLAVGAVIIDRDGTIIATGRNRAYDDATETDPLERTPIAHAEMNALARVDIDIDTRHLTLWSTQRPCPMCRAAIDFIGIGTVIAIATDPSAPADRVEEPLADRWVVLATAMFLVGPLRRAGRDHPTVQANLVLEPEAVALAEQAATDAHPLSDGRSLRDAVAAIWDDLESAAARRRQRITAGIPREHGASE
jgi:tRNA(Arg) A34 adenosine deaminase TadA